MWARTFMNASRMTTSTKSGPCTADVHRRIIRDVESGRVMHDCIVDDTPDAEVYMRCEAPRNIRVELVMKDAAKWLKTKYHDIVELWSPPRIVREAGLRSYGGKRLKPGWSLD